VADRQKVRSLRTRREGVNAISFSPDSAHMYCLTADGSLLAFDAQTWLDRVVELPASNTEIARAIKTSLSPDGKELAVWEQGIIKLFDTTTGKETRLLSCKIDPPPDTMNGAQLLSQFSPDGRFIATSWNDIVKLWDVDRGLESQLLARHSSPVCSIATDGKGELLACGNSAGSVNLWDLKARRPFRQFNEHRASVESVAISVDGSLLASGSADCTIRIRDLAKDTSLLTLNGHTAAVTRVCFTPNAKKLMSSSNDGTIRVWDLTTGTEVKKIGGTTGGARATVFSADGRIAALAQNGRKVEIVDLEIGKTATIFVDKDEVLQSVFLSEKGNRVIGCTKKTTDPGAPLRADEEPFTIKVWSTTTSSQTNLFQAKEELTSACTDETEQSLLAGFMDGTLERFDLKTSQSTERVKAHEEAITDATLLSKGKVIVTGSQDSTLKFWNGGAYAATMLPLDQSDWSLVTKSGAFDGSRRGMELTHFRVGKDLVQLKQLKEKYYTPGVLATLAGFSSEIAEVIPLAKLVQAPDVVCDAPTDDCPVLIIKVRDRGGGIGNVEVKLNDKVLNAEQVPRSKDPDLIEELVIVDLSRLPRKEGQSNSVSIKVFDKSNSISTRPLEMKWFPPAPKVVRKPEFYAIVAGVSAYASKDLELKFAEQDARAIAKALESAAINYFGPDKVHVTLLASPTSEYPIVTNPALTAGQSLRYLGPATKENVEEAFRMSRNATADDVVFVYLAGHGTIIKDPRDIYCFMASDATGQSDLTDPEQRAKKAITGDELTTWLKKIASYNQVLVLDSCGVQSPEAGSTQPSLSSRMKTMERLADATGARVLLVQAPDVTSQDANTLGQGVVSYALLKSMRGEKLDEDTELETGTLLRSIKGEIEQQAKEQGGQDALIAQPLTPGFVLGRVRKEEKASVEKEAASHF
jgi:WD40 repeat protein/uncharacterized caspase-like protein